QKRRITQNRLYAKYTNLVKKSVHANDLQARFEYDNKNTKATFNFVALRYDSEPDSLYTVSEQELSRYYNDHKNDPRYSQKPGRRFEYVKFPVQPSENDIAEAEKELQALREEFKYTKNDSLFSLANSDTRSYMV